ncbi:MAG: protein kinase [Methyloprofundus sp.]|nr:protein kinase [Methyloprofundus sp.]
MTPKNQYTNSRPAVKQDDSDQETVLIDSAPPPVHTEPEVITIKPGTTLNNRFDILEVIGSGGMGTVYKALDKRDIEVGNSYFIAIKVLNQECKNSPALLKSLYDETKKTQSLSHPNIVTVYDFDRASNIVYMTMEWIEGAPLNQIIKRNPLGIALPEAIDIITQIGNALSYAHSKHIIHLDLKPNNIYFDRNKHIKILDFGIAQKINSSLADNDEPSAALALTPSYASIELLNDKIPSPSDDIYAFACVCYEILTGKHPYNRERADIALKKHLLPKKIKSLNNQQWKALKKALAPQKKDRTKSIEQFLLEFNAKKSNLKYIILGGLLTLLLPFTYYHFQDNSNKLVATQQKKKEAISSLVNQTKANTTVKKPEINPYKKSDASTSTKQTKIDVSNTPPTTSYTSIKPAPSSTEKKPEETVAPLSSIQETSAKETGKINVWTDKEIYKIGDTLTISFDVDKALYVQIFIINSTGEITALFPNPYQPDKRLNPNQTYQIPPKNAQFTLDISEPKGEDRIIALASSKPFPTSTLVLDKSGEPIKNELTESYIQFQTTYRIY